MKTNFSTFPIHGAPENSVAADVRPRTLNQRRSSTDSCRRRRLAGKPRSLLAAICMVWAITTFTQPLQAQIYNGTLNLLTQADVDNFSYSEVTETLNIANNSSINNLDGLSSLTSVGVNLNIVENYALVDVGGLSSLTSVGGDLFIAGNTSLVNVDGLSSLTSVGRFVTIVENDQLTNLDGLGSLTSVGGFLGATFNDLLADFCGLYPLLAAGGLGGPLEIHDNLSNPTAAEILSGCGDTDADGVPDDQDICSNTPFGEPVDANGCSASQLDSDNDGVPNNVDECPNSDLRATVWIGGCDSGVANDFDAGTGCSLADHLAEQLTTAATGARNHGKFVSAMSAYLNVLKKAGLITGDQKGALMSCIGSADESQFRP